MPILDHVFNDMALALEKLDSCKLLMSFIGQRKVLAQLINELAMCSIIVLCADVTFDQYVDLNSGVH